MSKGTNRSRTANLFAAATRQAVNALRLTP